MKKFKWVILIILSVLAGYCFVTYLVCPPAQMILFLSLSLCAIAGMVLVIWILFRQKRWQPILLCFFTIIASYLVTTYTFLNQEIPHPLPELTRSSVEEGKGHTAVIYFTHGEHKEYSPNAWIETMRHLDHDGVPFIPKPFRPFFFNGFRREYIEAGTSEHNQIHGQMLASLSTRMLTEDDSDLKFYLSFLDTDPRPDVMMIKALNEGASKVVLMPVFLTISSHTAEGIELVKELDLAGLEIPFCIADPLWESEYLRNMFLTRANANRGNTAKHDIGIMLVGHGQPEEWDLTYPTQTEQENLFRLMVKEMLIENGYQAEKIVLSWMEFKNPQIAEGALELAEKGVKKILVFPASISANSIHTCIEIPKAIEEANLPADIDVRFMESWNDDPLVIEGIRQNILDCIAP